HISPRCRRSSPPRRRRPSSPARPPGWPRLKTRASINNPGENVAALVIGAERLTPGGQGLALAELHMCGVVPTDQRPGNGEQGNEYQNERADTADGEAPDECDQAEPFALPRRDDPRLSRRQWCELYLMLVCHGMPSHQV